MLIEKLSYTVVLDESLNFDNNLLNLPLPASEKMNSLVILYLEVSYITMLIFFIVGYTYGIERASFAAMIIAIPIGTKVFHFI